MSGAAEGGGQPDAPAGGPSDAADARARDIALELAGKSTARSNVMIVGAAGGLIACLAAGVVLATYGHMDTQTGGLIIGLIVSIATVFGACLQQAFSFEFGSSKGDSITQANMAAVTTQALSHLSDMGKNTIPTSAIGPIQQAATPQRRGTSP